jgi:hypothetical protein
MPTRMINLSEHWDHSVERQVSTGRFAGLGNRIVR